MGRCDTILGMMYPGDRTTTIDMNDAFHTATIRTYQRRLFPALKKCRAATLIAEGITDGTPWVEYEMDLRRWNPITGVKF